MVCKGANGFGPMQWMSNRGKSMQRTAMIDIYSGFGNVLNAPRALFRRDSSGMPG